MAMEERRMMMGFWLLFVCIWAWRPSSVNGDTNPSDVSALNVLYSSLNSAKELNGWTASGGDPCGQSWRGITCSDSSVTKIILSGMGLTGNLGYQLNSMESIVEIDLSNNKLAGIINYNLPQSLERLNLARNSLSGSIPYSISQMTSLKYLNLGHNQLNDSLRVYFQSLSQLSTMDLSSNSISGDLPDSLQSLSSLTTLYLQNNQFTGPINVLANLPLKNLNVANNHFTGWIPNQLKRINSLQTSGNSWSSGPAPPPPPYMPPPSNSQNQGSGASNTGGGGKRSGIGGGGIAGIIITILVISAIVAFFLIKRKTRKFSTGETQEQDQPFAPLYSNEMIVDMKPIQALPKVEMKPYQASPNIQTTAFQASAPIGLKPPPSDRHRSYEEDDFSNKHVVKRASKNPIKATSYSVADLQMATNSFSTGNFVGEGSVGSVYKAQFNDGKVLAVKKINSLALPPNQSTEVFIELVTNISRLQHPSLAELVGYCSEHGQYLLLYDFHKNGSVHDLLHLPEEYSEPLTWNSRVKIALGSARALEYLHEAWSPSVVHKNLKSANILLDMELNPHLSDCGLASLVPNTDYQAADSGYDAPEFAMSGQYTVKSDVYSFGVVMLELLTGRRPFDSSRPRYEQSLVGWASPQLHDIDALDKMVDPALEGLYPAKSLSRFADVIALCVQREPEFRPPMSEVVQSLVRLVQRVNINARLLGREDSITAS